MSMWTWALMLKQATQFPVRQRSTPFPFLITFPQTVFQSSSLFGCQTVENVYFCLKCFWQLLKGLWHFSQGLHELKSNIYNRKRFSEERRQTFPALVSIMNGLLSFTSTGGRTGALADRGMSRVWEKSSWWGRLTVKGYIDIVLERIRHHLFITSFWRTHTNTSARNAQLHNRSLGARQSWIQLNTKPSLCSLPS